MLVSPFSYFFVHCFESINSRREYILSKTYKHRFHKFTLFNSWFNFPRFLAVLYTKSSFPSACLNSLFEFFIIKFHLLATRRCVPLYSLRQRHTFSLPLYPYSLNSARELISIITTIDMDRYFSNHTTFNYAQ